MVKVRLKGCQLYIMRFKTTNIYIMSDISYLQTCVLKETGSRLFFARVQNEIGVTEHFHQSMRMKPPKQTRVESLEEERRMLQDIYADLERQWK